MSRALARVSDAALYATLRARGFRSRWIGTGLGPVHVLDAKGRGPRPTVLLLHGLGSQATDWGPFVHRLRRGVRRVLVVDLPGHGRSRMPLEGALREVMGHAGDLLAAAREPMVVIGNSLGGLTAVHALNATRCLGLVLLSPGGAPMNRTEMDAAFAPFLSPDYGTTLRFIDRIFARRQPHRRLIARALQGRFVDSPVLDLVRRATPADLLTPADLTAIDAPTLLIWGAKDDLLPAHGRDFFAEHLAQVECLSPAHVGHAPHVDDPRWTARQVLAFMDRIG